MVEISIRKRSFEEAKQVQKKFFKKTARGKVVKILRERYLRTDIPCGFADCPECRDSSHGASLSYDTPFFHNAFPAGHVLLPDTNIFLHQMDLVESSSFNAPMIILQTVMEEVRHRSMPLHHRLKALIQSGDKKIFTFYNEFHSDTVVVRLADETPNDKNDRAIRKAALWYQEHLATVQARIRGKQNRQMPTILLVTDDNANRTKASNEGVVSLSARDYVEGLSNAQQLLDLLSTVSESMDVVSSGARDAIYPEYLPLGALVAGVKSGQIHQGFFNANQYNYLEGSVKVPVFEKPVLLSGKVNMNRGVDGDVVAVEILPEAEWRSPDDEVVDEDVANRNDDAETDEEEEGERPLDTQRKSLVPLKSDKERQPTGRVVGIIKRNWRAYVCHIDSSSLSSSSTTSLSLQTVFATPVSRLLPRIRIRTRQAPNLLGQKILVNIDRWESNSKYPEGHFVRSLGRAESKEAEQESLLLEFDVPYRPFGKAILDCLPKEGDSWRVPPKPVDDGGSPVTVKEWVGREDLRELDICSIDPPGCQDIDDALHARLLENGNIEAGVHIADVSRFVLPDNPMDNEAASRGTTVYLVDKRIDMLPALLGTNLCSLRPHVERLAFSVIWELSPEAKIVDVRFTKSVIASKEAFTYEAAQLRKDDPALNDPLTNSIRLLNSLAINLKAARMAAGALNLASPEVKIHLDSSESSDPIDVEQKQLLETNSLVEEFMLLANISVARKIQETFPLTAVLRRHMPPPKVNFEKLSDILKKRRGLTLDVTSSGALAVSLDKCVDPNEPAFNTLVRIMATRCMLSAEYFCSGSVSKETFGHYGLASDIYTHFTSPIRRYADVLVHRQLAAAISGTSPHPSLLSKTSVERVMDNINRRHRMAQMAGRASVEFYVGLALKARGEKTSGGSVEEDAFIIRVFKNGIGVFVSSLGIEGVIKFKQDFTFDADEYSLTLPSTKGGNVTLYVFDSVRVGIAVQKDRNTLRGKVIMTLVNPSMNC